MMLSYCCHSQFSSTVRLGAHGKCGSLGCGKTSSVCHVCYRVVCAQVWADNRVKVTREDSDMSGDGCHPDGPNTHLLVSLHKLLQAGQRTNAPHWHVRELQLGLARLPPLRWALLLTGLSNRLAEGERKAVAVAHAISGEDGRRRGEPAGVRLLRMGGRAAAASLWGELLRGVTGQ